MPAARRFYCAVKLPLAFLMCLLASISIGSASAQETPNEPIDERPNVIFILADDMRADDMRFMPATRKLLGEQGMTFSNAFTTMPTCCPSRVSTFRGQYPHNHGVWANIPPYGGAERFRELGNEESTFATWLHDAGYRTGFVGKYLNGYTDGHVPPGWDSFEALDNNFYKDLKLHEDGQTKDYPESLYTDQLLGEKGRGFVSESSSTQEPFFLEVAFHGPHRPADTAGSPYPDTMRYPRSPGTRETDFSDKPSWLDEARAYWHNSRVDWDATYRERAGAVRQIDGEVASLVDALEETGELDNTYVVFSSDNGFHFGEHGLYSKGTPYTESLKVPLLIRGPGVIPGSTEKRLAINTDFAPTFADLGGADTPVFVDGRSLEPLLHSESSTWRKRFLFEWRNNPNFYASPYMGVRTLRSSYTRYSTGEQEFYNLNVDPYQLTSRHKTATKAVAAAKRQLEALRKCKGDSCRAAEDAP